MPRKLTPDMGLAAVDFQMMIRAEAASVDMTVKCINKKGERTTQHAGIGECVCVTCGEVKNWKKCHAGHFVAGRRPSILFIENLHNCHCQCPQCNMPWPRGRSGAQKDYHEYMLYVYDQQVIDELVWRKNNVSTHFTDDEILALRQEFRARTKEAVRLIDGR